MFSIRRLVPRIVIVCAAFYLIGGTHEGCLPGIKIVYAQEGSASIYGTAIDASGALLPEVKVTAVNETTGIRREALTRSDGTYTLPLLPAGTYTLTAELPGFATLRVTDVVLRVSINSNVPIVLEPKEIAETVSVASRENTVDTSSATVAYSVTNEQVQKLPILTSSVGRSPLSVLPFLVPGVTPVGDFGSSGTSNRLGEAMSVNGNRTISISYNFDGGDNNDSERNLAASTMPNPDALQEFTIVTNNYQADLGRSSGGVLNAVTKTGTNSLHGNVRYFRIHESLNARSFFDRAIPLNRLDTYGGQVGGPVVFPSLYNGRDRTHFFFDYEGTRNDQQRSNLVSLMSDAERVGDFSQLPTAQRPRDPRTGQPFPGGRIPAERIDPIAKHYLDQFIPRANEGLRNYLQLLLTERKNDQVTTRITHKLSNTDNLSGTFFYSLTESLADSFNLPIGTRDSDNSVNKNLVLSETHIFSPQTVNQFIFTVTRFVSELKPLLGSSAAIHPREAGFTGVRPQTDRFLALPTVLITPNITVPIGATSAGSVSAKTTWQLKDDLWHMRKSHALKFGGELRSFLLNSIRGNDNGRFGFTPGNPFGSGNAISDFLLGLPAQYLQSTGNTMYPRQKAYSFYAMDNWKAQQGLMINLGVRYELTIPMKDQLDQILTFRPGQRSQRFPNAPVGLLFVGDPDPILGSVPRAGYRTDRNNIAPRLGIAYSPNAKSGLLHSLFGESRTAIRLGWGVFYDQSWGGNVTQFQFVQPFAVSQSLGANQINAAGGTFANPFGSIPNPWPIDLNERQFTGFPALQMFDPTYRTAYTLHYNLSIQRELPWSLMAEIAYVGSNTFKADRERELNLGIVGPGANPGNLQLRRTYPQFGSIANSESSGRARYDSGQFRLSRRFRQGLGFDASYVFSKSLDNGSSPQGIGFFFSLGAVSARSYPSLWARSAFDRNHNFVLSYTYDLPELRRSGFLGRITNGWQVGGITQFRSGGPMEIFQFLESTLTGATSSGNPDLVSTFVQLDPRQARTFIINGVPQTGNYFFDPTAFRAVTVANFTQARRGSLGRNRINGPGVNLSSVSLIKRTRLAESHEIELRADISNVFNRTNFGSVDRTIEIPSFGQARSAAPGRTIQLSARYTF